MALLDLALLLLVAVAAWTGWRAGGLRTAAGAAGTVLGLVVGLALAGWVARSGLTFATRVVLEVAVVVVAATVVAGLAHRFVRPLRHPRTPPAVADRLLGAGLRGVGALLLAGLVLQAVSLWSTPGTGATHAEPALARALSAPSWLPEPGLLDVTDAVRSVLPADLSGIVPATAPATDQPVYISDRVADAVLPVTAGTPGSASTSEGSGFVISGRRVVTAYHVVHEQSEVSVAAEGRTYRATVTVTDTRNDIAVLSVPGLTVPPLTVSTVRPRPGAAATVVGYPYGGRQRARSASVVGGIAIPVGSWSPGGPTLRPGYRLATQVRPGNSGGPLLSADGAVIGVVDARSLVNPEVGYAITAEPLLNDLAAAPTVGADLG